jgi:hypothetical protein
MSRVRALVQAFLSGEQPPSDETPHTFYLTPTGRAQLDALTQIAKRSKTRVGSDILAAALEEAINALPDELLLVGKFPLIGESQEGMYTPTEFVGNSIAHWEQIEEIERSQAADSAAEIVERTPKRKAKA